MNPAATAPASFQALPGQELPLFRLDQGRRSLFYTPGWLACVPGDQAAGFQAELSGHDQGQPASRHLRQAAQQAQQAWQTLWQQPYRPVCLTLYLNNQCNLACTYCYADPGSDSQETLSLEHIQAGAELVAANCQAQNLPLTVVFHGGGEPTLNGDLLQQALAQVEQVAHQHGLALFRYIATNGVMSREMAAWLAAHFDLVGLSCDGPPEIQTHQRPTRSGQDSSTRLERTAIEIRRAGKPLHVRVTITPETVNLLPEIAKYLCECLQPAEIHIEPVYTGGRVQSQVWEQAGQAQAFVAGFLQARAQAKTLGVRVSTSGSRLGEVHGPYCNLLRPVLNLVPGGSATGCFKLSRASQVHQTGLECGWYDQQTGLLAIDQHHIQRLRRELQPGREAPTCQDCFNRYHCVRGCPDTCWQDGSTHGTGFRCQLQRLLAQEQLLELAGPADRLTNQVQLVQVPNA